MKNLKRKVFRGVSIKDNKLLISLLIAFLVLIVGLAVYTGSIDTSSESSMMPYDFLNFTMDVPKGTFFDESISYNLSTFKEVNNEFSITYINSDDIYQKMIDTYNSSSSNTSVEFEGNLTIVNIQNKDIIDFSYGEMIIMGSGDEVIMIQGNDLVLLKNMASTLKLNSN